MSVLHAYPAVVPLLERLSTIERTRVEDYGPRQQSHPVSISTSPPQQKYEGVRWQGPVSMSDHRRRAANEASPSTGAEGYQIRSDMHNGLPREQLPPLSSILGVSHSAVHSRSLYADQSPTFSPASPLDSRHTHGPMRHEKQVWDTYPQRPPPHHPVSSQYLYATRPSQPSISDLVQPPRRAIQMNSSPNSPQFYDSRYSPKDSPRTQLPPSSSNWSPRSEPSYRDYFPATSRDTSSSFGPQRDQLHPMPPPTPRKESESAQVYKEVADNISSMQKYAATSVSNIVSDSVTSKDGLGPKIWTGTQFLPRFVRQAEVPGEGLCYFYDDGTHCKTHIDGEAVNAHWGVTKAGKPRKRLAIACITCREKKIKCDPDYPRCTQCEKFGRVCKFKNAPRGGQGSPDLSPEADEISHRPISQISISDITRQEKRDMSLNTFLHTGHRQSSVESDDNPAKRAKYDHTAPASDNDPEPYRTDNLSKQRVTSTSQKFPNELTSLWATNPFDAEEGLVRELMRLYFIHKGISGTHGFFPEKPFMLWLTNRSFRKSPDDLMLMYTMLALASIFSSDPAHRERGKEFAAISRYACDQRHYSLQLVQSRLLLALYYYALNNVTDSWDFNGAAMRAATGIKLNLEIEETGAKHIGDIPYNLNQHGYAECRRRTFWACYVLDRFNGYCSGQLSIMNPEDVFLRLPGNDDAFEEQAAFQNPYFDSKFQSRGNMGTIGEMAYLITITSIWGDIMANIYRSSRRPNETEAASKFKSFYSDATSRLESWRSSLSASLSYSPENLAQAVNSGSLNIFITLHTLYHSAQMRLSRYVRPDAIPSDQLEHHVRTANSHAEAVLLMSNDLAPLLSQSSLTSDAEVAFSAPFIGYAIVHAIDIITAKGYLSDLPILFSKLRGATAVVTHLAKYWQSAVSQKEILVTRNADLIAGPVRWKGLLGERDFAKAIRSEDRGEVENGEGAGGLQTEGMTQKLRNGTYEMKTAIDQTLVRDFDCIYAVDLEVWNKALMKSNH